MTVTEVKNVQYADIVSHRKLKGGGASKLHEADAQTHFMQRFYPCQFSYINNGHFITVISWEDLTKKKELYK